jgi:hypothetical protein
MKTFNVHSQLNGVIPVCLKITNSAIRASESIYELEKVIHKD